MICIDGDNDKPCGLNIREGHWKCEKHGGNHPVTYNGNASVDILTLFLKQAPYNSFNPCSLIKAAFPGYNNNQLHYGNYEFNGIEGLQVYIRSIQQKLKKETSKETSRWIIIGTDVQENGTLCIGQDNYGNKMWISRSEFMKELHPIIKSANIIFLTNWYKPSDKNGLLEDLKSLVSDLIKIPCKHVMVCMRSDFTPSLLFTPLMRCIQQFVFESERLYTAASNTLRGEPDCCAPFFVFNEQRDGIYVNSLVNPCLKHHGSYHNSGKYCFKIIGGIVSFVRCDGPPKRGI
jgi:hypothetical protein